MKGECDFTYRHYEFILDEIRRFYNHYTFNQRTEVDRGKPIIFIRHDVDCGLHYVLNIARLERKYNIRTTYFVRIDAIGYNPFSYPNSRHIIQLRELGHEIGLHFSTSKVAQGNSVLSYIKQQKDFVEAFFGIEIVSASAHEPTRQSCKVTEQELNQIGIKNYAYGQFFFRELKYISESGGEWREGCVCNFLAKKIDLQVLTHPFWWYESTPLENY